MQLNFMHDDLLVSGKLRLMEQNSVFGDEKACLSSRSKWVTGRQSSINNSICAPQCLLPFPQAESG